MTKLRIAVVSDIHAASNSPRDTYVHTEPPASSLNEHPAADLIAFAEHRGLTADVLVCPGDLANKSDDRGKLYGWRALNQLKAKLRASFLFASPGNHDLETHEIVGDSAEVLKNLAPSYPSLDEVRDTTFWNIGISIYEGEHWRIVNLNSCFSFPPHPPTGAAEPDMRRYQEELNRGKFSVEQETALRLMLTGLAEKPVNILLCHHHPVEHQLKSFFQDDYGPMHRGGNLISLLDEMDHCGRWFIIHGHKHIPMIDVGGASANAPILLCAASVGGKLWHPIVTVTRNQFHIIEFELEAETGLSRTRGIIESYSWGFGAGWRPAPEDSGLPGVCGFGMVIDPRDLADRVAILVDQAPGQFLRAATLYTSTPELRFQMPRDTALLERLLLERGKVVHRDRLGRIYEIAQGIEA